jgi:O-antigen/teichoic acid export membrane protein
MSGVGKHDQARATRQMMLRRTAMAGAIAKVVSAICNFLMVPILLGALGESQFGMWATYQSLQMLLPFADFGIGNGMMNAITGAASRDDEKAIQRLVTTGTAMLLAVALACGLVLAIAWPQLATWLGSGLSSEAGDVQRGLAVFFVGGLVAIPLSCADRLAAGMQAGYVPHVVRGGVAVASLGAVALAAMKQSRFPTFCLATVGPPLLAPLVTWWWLSRSRPYVVPRLHALTMGAVPGMLRTGIAFLAVQCAAILGFGFDLLMIEKLAGAEKAGEFAIVQRFFSVVPVVAAIVLSPLWPAYADAQARSDFTWISSTFRSAMVRSVFGSAAVVFAMVAVSPWVMPMWVGIERMPTASMIMLYAVWTVVYVCGMAFAMLWNGMHWLRLQAVLGMLFAVMGGTFKLLQIPEHGAESLVVANTACFIVLALIPGFFLTERWLRAATLPYESRGCGG